MMPSLLVVAIVAFAEVPGLHVESVDGVDRVRVVANLPTDRLAEVPRGKVERKFGERLLQFCLVGEEGKLGPPVFGKYERRDTSLVFVPRYGLVHGETYRAVLRLSGKNVKQRDYRVPPRKPDKPAVVERIYPSGDVLPANHLKFYIYFSKPMREGRAIFDRIKLLDESGDEVINPWRRQELWSKDARRFTLWIHPGRVKTGVNLREDEGPVLVPRRKYTLVIGAEVQDTHGQRIGRSFTKRFATIAADDRRPLPNGWKLTPPTANSRAAVKLEFGEPLDFALLQRLLKVVDSAGSDVAGEIVVGEDEKSWTFRPEKPWKSSPYAIKVDGELEDLAGNTPLRMFDTDLGKPRPGRPNLALPFKPGKP